MASAWVMGTSNIISDYIETMEDKNVLFIVGLRLVSYLTLRIGKG